MRPLLCLSAGNRVVSSVSVSDVGSWVILTNLTSSLRLSEPSFCTRDSESGAKSMTLGNVSIHIMVALNSVY